MSLACVTLCHIGTWSPEQVEIQWTASSWRGVEGVDWLLQCEWEKAARRLGAGGQLFDGPMCRLEACSAEPGRLRLLLSQTSYRVFLGTNLTHADLADRYGAAVLANPVGLSVALRTGDDMLLLGRRNERVAYYPGRIHPFAGALEPPSQASDRPDVFGDVLRELNEELSLPREDIADLRCIGLVEDCALRQPELIFSARCCRTRAELDAMLDDREHRATRSIAIAPGDVASALDEPLLTPVAVGALLLFGRRDFGPDWFNRHRAGRALLANEGTVP